MKVRIPLPEKTEVIHKNKRKYNRKKKVQRRDLDQEARDLEFETGGRCGQFEVE